MIHTIAPISPLQLSILQKLCEGKSPQQVADDLNESLGTVRSQQSLIYKKWGRLEFDHSVQPCYETRRALSSRENCGGKSMRSDEYYSLEETAKRLEPDEPYIVIRARDKHFLKMIKFYYQLIEEDHEVKVLNPSKTVAVLISLHDLISRTMIWLLKHPSKGPDMPTEYADEVLRRWDRQE